MAMFILSMRNDAASFCMLAAIGDISTSKIWAVVLGVLLAIVAVTLLIASWTKWGQTKSLTKCIALAFLAHVWLLMYAYGTRIVMPGFGGGSNGGVHSDGMVMSMPLLTMDQPAESLEEGNTEAESDAADSTDSDKEQSEQPLAPWEAPLARTATAPANEPTIPEVVSPPKLPVATEPAPSLPKIETAWTEPELPSMDSLTHIEQLATPPTAPQVPPTIPPVFSSTAPSLSSPANLTSTATTQSSHKRKLDSQPVPTNYQMRLSPQRQQFSMLNGGDANTEAAVERALAWLAQAQGPDGGWNAAQHGAGREPPPHVTLPDSEYRQNTGLKANTAMTGLALLAFLGAGHTHTDGQYQANVTRGLQYLLSQQLPSGDLAGRDQVGRDPTVRFARMYSHGMAALALTEAYGMTGDAILLPPIQSACRYTLNAMNPRTGGWRYEAPTDDPGDLSQFGWQAMLLHSAESNKSVLLPDQSHLMMNRFLDSVATGKHGGLAVYRPRPGRMPLPEQATPAMTAEAMASRLLLELQVAPQAAEECQAMMLRNLPTNSEENLYYWYYATLAMYQLRGETNRNQVSFNVASSGGEQAWTQWNDSLKQQLCSTQLPRGKNQGSWEPTCIWGSYGGRVYSTAVACMCLEVYYRYLPLYKANEMASQPQPPRR